MICISFNLVDDEKVIIFLEELGTHKRREAERDRADTRERETTGNPSGSKDKKNLFFFSEKLNFTSTHTIFFYFLSFFSLPNLKLQAQT